MDFQENMYQIFFNNLIKRTDVKFAAIISRNGLLEISVLPKTINTHKFAAMVATMIESLGQVCKVYGSKTIAKITVSEMDEEQLFIGTYHDNDQILAIISPRELQMTKNKFLIILKQFHNDFY